MLKRSVSWQEEYHIIKFCVWSELVCISLRLFFLGRNSLPCYSKWQQKRFALTVFMKKGCHGSHNFPLPKYSSMLSVYVPLGTGMKLVCPLMSEHSHDQNELLCQSKIWANYSPAPLANSSRALYFWENIRRAQNQNTTQTVMDVFGARTLCIPVEPVRCWSQLSTSLLSAFIRAAWNQPRWECLHNGYRQTIQIRSLFLGGPAV